MFREAYMAYHSNYKEKEPSKDDLFRYAEVDYLYDDEIINTANAAVLIEILETFHNNKCFRMDDLN